MNRLSDLHTHSSQSSWMLDLTNTSKLQRVAERNVSPTFIGRDWVPRDSARFEAQNGVLPLLGIPIGYLDFDHETPTSDVTFMGLPVCIPLNQAWQSEDEESVFIFEESDLSPDRYGMLKYIHLAKSNRQRPSTSDVALAPQFYHYLNKNRGKECSCSTDSGATTLLKYGMPPDPPRDYYLPASDAAARLKYGTRPDLPRSFFLPEARSGDVICVLSGGDGCFLLRHTESGFFRVMGSAFRSSHSWPQLERDITGTTALLVWPEGVYRTYECKIYVLGAFWFDVI
jgi:hypothetical protein